MPENPQNAKLRSADSGRSFVGEHSATVGLLVWLVVLGLYLLVFRAVASISFCADLPREILFFGLLLPLCAIGAHLLSGGMARQRERADRRLEAARKDNRLAQKAGVLGLTRVTAARDESTSLHLRRVGLMTEAIARALARNPKYSSYVTESYIADLVVASALHDIGRVGISDEILRKKGSLTAAEFDAMKMHTIIGGDIISELQRALPFRSYYELAREIAYHHHQRWDGTGYPNVLSHGGGKNSFFVQTGVGSPYSGEQIPLSARIVAVADVYDALVSRRPYKEPIPHKDAVRTVLAERGTHFDPDVVDAFEAAQGELERIVGEIRD